MTFKKTLISLLLALSVSIYSLSYAKSPVFKVSKGGDYVYIGGTIHLLSPSDYPLPLAFDTAFKDSKRVFFEVDGKALETLETQTKMLSILTFQDGRTLETVLDKETYGLLSNALSERQMPISVFKNYTPIGIGLTLTVLELQRLGLGDPNHGVDHFFQLKTDQDASKDSAFLETVDQQIGFLSQFNNVDPNAVIKSSLEDLSVLNNSWKLGVDSWRDGDLAQMNEVLGGEKMRSEFPSVYKALLSNRNQHWIKQLTPMFDTPEIEFLLVGAMHLVGDDGVIELLRDQGYEIEQLD